MSNKNYKLSRAIKLGHLLYDKKREMIVLVDIEVLEDLIEIEKIIPQSHNERYFNIPLSHDWLVKIFDFDFKYLNVQDMTVYTSSKNEFKVHEKRGGFTLPYTSRTKHGIGGMSGQVISKAKVQFVNDLIDYLWLLQRDLSTFRGDDLEEINKLIKVRVD